MAAKIVYTWVPQAGKMRVNWRLVGGNGEIMCFSNQGFKDVRDARRAVAACGNAINGSGVSLKLHEEGPGPKPKDPPHGGLQDTLGSTHPGDF